MALPTSSNFSAYLVPDGATDPPANASQPVVLTLSDGTAVTVADSKVHVWDCSSGCASDESGWFSYLMTCLPLISARRS